jgi:hypothetical protein
MACNFAGVSLLTQAIIGLGTDNPGALPDLSP